jgi:cob(I)alamin adenosyltransferase
MTIRLNRITTCTGDSGGTHLGDGSSVSKLDERIEAIGDIDELNSHVGVALECAGVTDSVRDTLITVQHQLFDLGADVSQPELPDDRHRVTEDDLLWIEQRATEVNEPLPGLTSFILPGGGPLSAQLHVCRTVCRRAERRVVALGAGTVEARYLNRLSDLFFILGRSVSIGNERLWEQARR